mgnify:CR=1 FL=1
MYLIVARKIENVDIAIAIITLVIQRIDTLNFKVLKGFCVISNARCQVMNIMTMPVYHNAMKSFI